MSRGVLTIYSESKVRKAIKIMVDHKVGSVVVLDSEGPEGVFTERDLLSKVLGRGNDPDNVVLAEVISPLFVAVKPGATLEDAAKMMVSKNSRLMVFDDGELEGLVTATDIVRTIQKLSGPIDLGKVMTKKLVTELAETPLNIVIHDMDSLHVGSVLVAEDERRPYGIFTERDLLVKVLARRLGLQMMVRELVSVPLITAPIGIDGTEAAKMMVTKQIKRLPLTRGDEIMGIVTARDVVEAFAKSR